MPSTMTLWLIAWALIGLINLLAFRKELKALRGKRDSKAQASKCFIYTIVVTGPVFWVGWLVVGLLIPLGIDLVRYFRDGWKTYSFRKRRERNSKI